MNPFSINKLAIAVSFTDGASFTLPPGIKISADSVEILMSKNSSGSLVLDSYALNCSIEKNDTVVPVCIKRLTDIWHLTLTVEDDGVIPIHLDILESVIPGLSLPSGIGDSGIDIREISLKLTDELDLIEFYVVADIKGFGSIVSFGLLHSSIPVNRNFGQQILYQTTA